MTLVPVTYIKSGETPANWFDLAVIDKASGNDVRFVVEANTKEGWARQQVIGRDGRFLRFAGEIVTKRIEGDFAIINPGVPGRPVEMQPVPRPKKPRTSPTTRVVFGAGRRGGLLIVGPGGHRPFPQAQFSLLMTLCGKPDSAICDWVYLSESLWPDPEDMPDAGRDVLQTQVCNLRRTLKAIKSEIKIMTHWGRGYSALRGPYPVNDNNETTPAASASA